jgi:hypothetical protein
MIKFLILIFFTGCSSLYQKKQSSLQDVLLGREQKIFYQKDESGIDLKKILENKRFFITSIFIESFELYDESPRWSAECLEENKIGQVTEDYRGYYLPMVAILNSYLEPGFCSDNSYTSVSRKYLVYFACKGNRVLGKFIADYSKADPELNWSELCE